MSLCKALLNDRSVFVDADEARAVEDALNAWKGKEGDFRKLIPNLCSDPHLPKPVRAELMWVITHNRLMSNDDIKTAYRNACAKYPLKGPKATGVPSDNIFWNAVREDYFVDRVKKWGWPPRACNRFLNSIRTAKGAPSGTYISYPHSGLKRFSPRNMWGTWVRYATMIYPFPSWYGPDHVRACLGLDQLDRAKPLLVFRYKVPGGVVTRVPTVADAGTFPYFRPNIGETCGLTDPWSQNNSLFEMDGITAFRPRPAPEVIHESVKLKDIQKVFKLV